MNNNKASDLRLANGLVPQSDVEAVCRKGGGCPRGTQHLGDLHECHTAAPIAPLCAITQQNRRYSGVASCRVMIGIMVSGHNLPMPLLVVCVALMLMGKTHGSSKTSSLHLFFCSLIPFAVDHRPQRLWTCSLRAREATSASRFPA
jgi:hypothetical protein